MKKLIFANNEEKKIIRHLHESVKRQYLNLNEQTTIGKWDGVTDSPLDTDKSEEVDDNDSMISDVSIGQRDASDITYKPKKVSRPPNPIVTELQTNLNVKFSSGLVEDGYLGQKTRNAIYDALTKGPQQTTQQTITVPQPVTVGAGTPNDDN